MYRAITRRFWFEEPVAIQRRHLLDVRHLVSAHRWTLVGLGIQSVRPLGIRHLEVILTRFGRVAVVELRQEGMCAWVYSRNFRLDFEIHPAGDGHFLEVTLYTIYPYLRWLSWLLGVVMWLTVIEDRIYLKTKKL